MITDIKNVLEGSQIHVSKPIKSTISQEDTNWYTYLYFNLDEYEKRTGMEAVINSTIYIGKGDDNRIKHHRDSFLNSNSSMLYGCVRNMWRNKQKLAYIALKHNEEVKAYQLESILISYLVTNNYKQLFKKDIHDFSSTHEILMNRVLGHSNNADDSERDEIAKRVFEHIKSLLQDNKVTIIENNAYVPEEVEIKTETEPKRNTKSTYSNQPSSSFDLKGEKFHYIQETTNTESKDQWIELKQNITEPKDTTHDQHP
ncbi:hypothetical protein AKO1_008866, partial [Acrasis kona]